MKKILLYLLPLLMIAGCQKADIQQDEPTVLFGPQLKAALLELYNATDGPNWTKQPNWAESEYPELDFISHDFKHLKLDLSNMGLSGELPSSLFELPFTDIKLSDNHLHGTLPDNVGENGFLETLYLDDNDFTGNLPASLAKSHNVYINCRNNKMSGMFPQEILDNCRAFPNWKVSPQQNGSGFDQLEPAELDENDLIALCFIYNEANDAAKRSLGWKSEPDPRDWTGVYWNGEGRCIGLSFNDKKLSNLSSHVAELTELKHLSLKYNSLSEFPPISAMKHLEWLDVSYNKISSVPDSLIFSTDLTFLDMHHNLCQGEFPSSILQLKNLVLLDLNDNKFTGVVPSLENLKELRYLDLSFLSELDPQPLPESIGKLKKLNYCSLMYSSYFGTIPASWSKLPNLRLLNLQNNRLDGSLEHFFHNMTQLSMLYLDYNSFSGTLPEFNEANSMRYFSLNGNCFSGEIPDHWSRLKKIQTLRFNENAITGNFPSFFGEFKQLEELLCEGNMMSGVLPVELTELEKLDYFQWKKQNGPGLTWPETKSFVLSGIRTSADKKVSATAPEQEAAKRQQEIKERFAGELRQSLGF